MRTSAKVIDSTPFHIRGGLIDPCLTRLGDNFVLSDFLHNDSVIRKGDANIVPMSVLDAGDVVAAHIIKMGEYANLLVSQLGPCSISYGYISHEQSMRRVKWKNPALPSYHRWDDGAAADFLFHDQVHGNEWDGSPYSTAIAIVKAVADGPSFSRLITYGESPWICVATGIDDDKAQRQAMYWNVYEGFAGAKPRYISFTKNDVRMVESGIENENMKIYNVKETVSKHGWVGAGHPTSHGGGIRQAHHIRMGKWLMLSDVLRSPANITLGQGRPTHCRPPRKQSDINVLKKKVKVLDRCLDRYYGDYWGNDGATRVSILSGYKGTVVPHEADYTKELDWDDRNAEFILSVADLGFRNFDNLLDAITDQLERDSKVYDFSISHVKIDGSYIMRLSYEIT
jgi:hypothetical protein